MSGVSVTVDVSVGELIDKITILEIKAARLGDAAQLSNVKSELKSLVAVRDAAVGASAELTELSRALKKINERLWRIEDDIRDRERAQDFGPRFIELARSVYVCNDERSALKRRINELLGSRIVEEKSYAPY